MTFLIVFLILYGLGFGICMLTTILLDGTDKLVVKYTSLIPIINVIGSIIIVIMIFYIVKDYKQNKNKTNNKQIKDANV